MAHFRRARWGVRRTFQTEQAIEELSIYDNVAMVARALLQGPRRRSPRRRPVGDRVRGTHGQAADQGRHPGRRRAAPRRAGARRRGPAPRDPARRAGGRPSRGGERAHRAGDPEDPRRARRARDPRGPRHEPGVRLLQQDRGAGLRQADRLGGHRGRAAQRRRSRRRTSASRRWPCERRRGHGRGDFRGAGRRRAAARGPDRGARCASGRARRVARGHARRGHGAARPERRRQVEPRARGGWRPARRRREGHARSRRPHVSGVPSAIRQAGVAIVPEGRRLLPLLTVRENLGVATYSLSRVRGARRG